MPTEFERVPETTTYNLLFVCTGNTCRSPLAEVLARRELARRGWGHVSVASAGTNAAAGAPASAEALAVAARRGLDLGYHRSRPLTPDAVRWADLVLAMGPSHRASVQRLGGDDKVALLTDFAAGADGIGHAVADPFGGSEAVYEETARELEALIAASLDRLAPILHP